MRHPLSSSLIVLLIALPAAAGLNIEAPASYRPGDQITVTLSGDSEGRTAGGIRAVLAIDSDLTYVSGSPGTLLDSFPHFLWAFFAGVGSCGTGGLAPNQCLALDAIEYSQGVVSYPNDLLPSTLSTLLFDTSNATGDLFFSLNPDGVGFFGLPGTPPPSSR